MRKNLLSCLGLAAVILSGNLSARGQTPLPVPASTPPFNQAPPVGADTSAGILLFIDVAGSLRVYSDPTQGPYDDDDDTLVGVQNDSPSSISAIPLRSSLSVFGFDGDGLSTYTGVSYGPTGYEGPGTSFSGISADQTSGTVNFNPPIPPGGSAYFSLENAIQTQCPPLTPPSLLKQGDPQWAALPLGTSKQNIGDQGCYITSMAMMINYHAASQGLSFRTDPAQLDAYLTAHNEFDANGAVNAGGEAVIADYARTIGKMNLWYTGEIDYRDDFTLDQYLCGGQPAVIFVGKPNLPHWVLAYGQTTVNDASGNPNDSYLTLDPDSYPNGDTLYGGFGNNYGGIELFSDISGQLAGLYVVAHSPVELVLTAPDGTQAGFDPVTGTKLNSLASSSYAEHSLANDIDHTQPNTPVTKNLQALAPIDGDYILEVHGTGAGPYTLDLAGFDSNGGSSSAAAAGTATVGSYASYVLHYSSLPGSTIAITETDVPIIGGTLAATATLNAPFSYQITSSGNPTSYAATGLPAGLQLDAASGVISGTPTQVGTFTVALTATNAAGSGMANLALTVNPNPPVISGETSLLVPEGELFSYQVTASNSPTAYAAAGLPAGLQLDAASGVISGTPTQVGTFTVALTATNAGGTGAATLTLTLKPVVTLMATVPAAHVGSGETGKITFNLSAPQTAALVIHYSLKGSAANGTDYVQLSGQKKIKAGKTNKTINIIPRGHFSSRTVKKLKLTLLPDDAYLLGTVTRAKIKLIGDEP